MKRDDRGFIRRDQADVDPGVAATLSAGQQRQADQQLSPSERALLARARDKERKRQAKRKARYLKDKERRADYLLDPAVIDWTQQQADALGCSASQVTEFALRYLAGAIRAGEVDLSIYLLPTPLPRFPQRLSFPQLSELAQNGGGNCVATSSQLHSNDYTVDLGRLHSTKNHTV